MENETIVNKKIDFYIESHDTANLDELLVLIKTNYTGGDITNKKYLEWQYYSNPFGSPVMQVARQVGSNELVGQYLVIPIEYVHRGMRVKGSLSLNTLTREDFRGKGLFTKMAAATYKACSEKGINFTIGFPNQNSYPGFVKKLDFKNPGEFKFLVKPLNYAGVVLDKLKGIRKGHEKHGEEISIGQFNVADLGNNCRISELVLHRDKVAYETFWSSISSEYGFTTNKNYAYMKWRYAEIPTRTYTLLKIEKEDEIICVLALRTKIMYGIRTGVLIDFFGRRDFKQFHEPLYNGLKTIFKQLRSKSINLAITIINSATPEFLFLKSTGFFAPPEKILPQHFPFIIRNHQHPENDIIDFNDCYLMFGDYDVM